MIPQKEGYSFWIKVGHDSFFTYWISQEGMIIKEIRDTTLSNLDDDYSDYTIYE